MSDEKKGGDDLDDYVDEEDKKAPARPIGKAPKRGAADPKEEKDSAIKIGIEKVANAASSGTEWEELQKMWLWDEEEAYSPSVQEALDSRFRYCALMGNNVGCQFLAVKGATIDAQDSDGNTALHHSITPQEKHLERQRPIIEYLMTECGCNCDIKNKDGYTAKTHVPAVTSEKMVSIVRVLDVQRKPRESGLEETKEEKTQDPNPT